MFTRSSKATKNAR